LALSNTASSTSGSASSFVSGPISKTGATDFVFPTGKGTSWRRCAVTNISAADTYTAEYFNTPYVSTTPVNAPLNNVSLIEYWMCNRAGAGNAKLTLYWENAGTSGINNCPDLTIARWNGASWDERIGTASGTCSGAGTGSVITVAQLVAFSPFTFGSHLSTVNPLPISLVTFTAAPFGNEVIVNWSTASETNCDHYVVERTVDGLSMEDIGQLKGAGNSNTTLYYQFIDPQPLPNISYYRLKQVDSNGDIHYSQLVAVDQNAMRALEYSIYPNPNHGEFVIQGLNKDGADISIRNMIGDPVNFSVNGGDNGIVNINCAAIPGGVYFVTIKNNGVTKTHKLVIQ
jgi:hypothetical protein